MPKAAPVCKQALADATRHYPHRNRASDGICADAAHSSTSDHNDPDRDGYCEAFDLTHDPAAGCDAHALVREAVARRDPRIKYAISQGRIWSAARASEGWRPYSGANAHTKHAHVSTSDAHRDSIAPWWDFAPTPSPPTAIVINAGPTYEDNSMQAHFVSLHSSGARLDGNGNGYWDLPFPYERVVTVNPNVANPAESGYRVPDVGFLRWGGGIRVVAEEAVAGGGLDVVVWLAGP